MQASRFDVKTPLQGTNPLTPMPPAGGKFLRKTKATPAVQNSGSGFVGLRKTAPKKIGQSPILRRDVYGQSNPQDLRPNERKAIPDAETKERGGGEIRQRVADGATGEQPSRCVPGTGDMGRTQLHGRGWPEGQRRRPRF